jgi:hypothetical protein
MVFDPVRNLVFYGYTRDDVERRTCCVSKILVAVDASQPSLRALSKAAQLARRFQSEITLLHVVNYPVHYIDIGLVVRDVPASPEDLIAAGESVMQKAKEAVSLKAFWSQKKRFPAASRKKFWKKLITDLI